MKLETGRRTGELIAFPFQFSAFLGQQPAAGQLAARDRAHGLLDAPLHLAETLGVYRSASGTGAGKNRSK